MSQPVAVIVGVGPGNGASLARKFAAEGHAVALLSRSTDYSSKLAAELQRPLCIEGLKITPSASIGIAPFPRAASTTDELLSLADQAMYRAKRLGGGRIFIHTAQGPEEVH